MQMSLWLSKMGLLRVKIKDTDELLGWEMDERVTIGNHDAAGGQNR